MKENEKADRKVDKRIKDCTTKCDKGFKCLSESDHMLCKVIETVKDEVYFIECLEEKKCSYLVPVGKFKTCNCPTRKEIYRQYKR